MKPLKALLCCLAAALIVFPVFSPRGVARAATTRYARADARDIYFCKEKDSTYALFTIPYTYCVEIISTEGDWYYVKYAEDNALYEALYGYCLSKNLTPVDKPPENIYLNMPVTVTYRTDMPTGSLPVLNELNVTAAFYGTFYSGPTAYSYVRYDGKFGYIYGANDDYPLNEIPIDAEGTEKPSKGKGANTKLITVLALTAVAAAVLIVLYLTGRRRYFKP